MTKVANFKASLETDTPVAAAEAIDIHDVLPAGFIARRDGIYQVVSDDDGQTEEFWLCPPLSVTKRLSNSIGEGWSRLVEFTDPAGRKHDMVISDALLSAKPAAVISDLRYKGFNLKSTLKIKNAFISFLATSEPTVHALLTNRTGWSDDNCTAFVLGDKSVIGNPNVHFVPETDVSVAADMKKAGDVSEWRETIGRLCKGNPLLILGVSLAFAGPLLDLLKIEGGGLHFRGASSRGKSTVLRVATSVWGGPRFMRSWRSTANGLEGVAASCSGTLLALDEIGEAVGSDVSKAAYMLANGTGKTRARSSGQTIPAASWNTMVLSSGEISIAEKIAEGGGKVQKGQEIRLLDIEADARRYGAFDELHGSNDAAALAERLKSATATTYGSAGPALVERILRIDRLRFTATAEKNIARFRDTATRDLNLNEDGQTKRAVTRFALAAWAGEVATKSGLTGWSTHSATNAALLVLGEWADSRTNGDALVEREAVERIRAFLLATASTRFQQVGGATTVQEMDRAGWRDAEKFYFCRDTWEEIHRGIDATQAARYLRTAGFLIPGDGDNLARRTPHGVPDRPRLYTIRGTILVSANAVKH